MDFYRYLIVDGGCFRILNKFIFVLVLTVLGSFLISGVVFADSNLTSVNGSGSLIYNNSNGYTTISSLAVSDNGRYNVYSSNYNIIDNSNGMSNIFLFDNLTKNTTLISVASDGTPANQRSESASISGDGRYIVYTSYATNLVANILNSVPNVFMYDTLNKITTLISESSNDTPGDSGSGCGYVNGISDDGRYVIFTSYADNLVGYDTNGVADVFVRDTSTNITTRVSVASNGSQGNAGSWFGAISNNGRYSVFQSYASNLVTGDTNGVNDIFLHDAVTGKTIRISVSSNGTQSDGNSYYCTSISDNGQYIVFQSLANNLANGTNSNCEVYVYDAVNGITTLVSKYSNGTVIDGTNAYPVISDDGQYVVFTSLEPYQGNQEISPTDIYVHDIITGATTLIAKLDTSEFGLIQASISGDGKHVLISVGDSLYSYTDLLAFNKGNGSVNNPGDNNGVGNSINSQGSLVGNSNAYYGNSTDNMDNNLLAYFNNGQSLGEASSMSVAGGGKGSASYEILNDTPNINQKNSNSWFNYIILILAGVGLAFGYFKYKK
jgi:hypothetical protein